MEQNETANYGLGGTQGSLGSRSSDADCTERVTIQCQAERKNVTVPKRNSQINRTAFEGDPELGIHQTANLACTWDTAHVHSAS